jgi:hypothetical protein
MEPEIALPGLQQGFARLRAKSLPCSAILNRGKGTIAVERQERGLETIGRACVSEKVALTPARSRRIDCVRERQGGG